MEDCMGAHNTVTVELSEETAQDVEAAIACGDYADAEDVVQEALVIWRRRRQKEIERLRRLWEEGLASGEPQPVPDDWAEQIIARGKARLEAKRRAGGAA